MKPKDYTLTRVDFQTFAKADLKRARDYFDWGFPELMGYWVLSARAWRDDAARAPR